MNEDFSNALAQLLRSSGIGAARGRLLSWMRQFRSSYGYDRLFLFGSDGRLLMSYPETGTDDPTLAGAVPAHALGGSVSFFDFYRNPIDSRVYLSVMVPLGDAAGRALLAMRIDPEQYLYPYIKRWPTDSATAETLIVRREGDEVVFLNQLRFDAGAALTLRYPLSPDSSLPAARAALGERRVFSGIDYRGTNVLSALSPIDDSPWYLVARMDLAEINAGFLERRFIMTLLVSALLGAEAAGLVSLRRRWRIETLKREADAAAALRINEERLRLAIAAANQGLYDLNVITGEAVVNDEYAVMLGYDPADFHETNAAWMDRMHPDEKESVSRVYQDYAAGKIPEYRVEFRQRTKDGYWKWILSLGKLISWDSGGQPLRMIGTHTDITERKTHEQELSDLNADLERKVMERTAQLEASNKELQDFAYSVAHDLRAPLRSIDGFARILREEYLKELDGEGLRLVDIIRSSDQKMEKLISDLLEITRIGKTEQSFAFVDMRELAIDVFNNCADPAALSDFTLKVGELPAAMADSTMMRQVWTNLLSNAVKYSLPSSVHKIEIEGKVLDGMNVYSVKDYGVGFDPRYVGKLFGVFQRLHSSSEFPGSGIGLAIVKKIVERHGGRAWAESGLGEGAVFYFSLPVGVEHGRTQAG